MRWPWRAKPLPAHEEPIELRLPSRLGYEKVAMDMVASVAERLGLTAERVAGLRTAISEAVTNAIEHGNRGLAQAEVHITIEVFGDRLVVCVRDQHYHRFNRKHGETRPDLARALNGEDVGWGMWLIRQFVDDVEWTAAPNGGNQVRMIWRVA